MIVITTTIIVSTLQHDIVNVFTSISLGESQTCAINNRSLEEKSGKVIGPPSQPPVISHLVRVGLVFQTSCQTSH